MSAPILYRRVVRNVNHVPVVRNRFVLLFTSSVISETIFTRSRTIRLTMEKLGQFLGIVDYLVIVVCLLFCTVFGIFYKRQRPLPSKDGKVAEYFLGSRRMTILPVALSMVVTSVSAIPLVSGVGEMYAYGFEYSISFATVQLGKILAAFLIVPVFRYMDYVSIYQYLENRFDRKVRFGFAIVYVVLNIMQISVALYLSSFLVAKVTGSPFWITAVISGLLCTLYCVMGGFRAVIWTDVIQFILIVTSLVLVIWTGTVAAGGPSVILREGFSDGFFKSIYWLDTPDKRFTVISSTVYGFFLGVQTCSTSQAVLQRLLSVKDIRSAQKTVLLTSLIGVTLSLLLLIVAAVIYAIFRLCDPLQQREYSGVYSTDLMLLYFMQKYFACYPGFSGIVFAGILSSSLSTVSSYINSFAAITLEDFIKPYFPLQKSLKNKEIVISKIMTAVFGCVVILLSFTIPYLGGVIKLCTSVMGSFGGPLTGLMCLGIFVQRVKKRACLIGMFTGIAFCLWIAIGSKSVQQNYRQLPLSTDGCPVIADSNMTIVFFNVTSLSQTTTSATTAQETFPLYLLSFVWYGPIGFFITVAVAVAASFILNEKQKDVDVRLLSPVVKKKHQPAIFEKNCYTSVLNSNYEISQLDLADGNIKNEDV